MIHANVYTHTCILYNHVNICSHLCTCIYIYTNVSVDCWSLGIVFGSCWACPIRRSWRQTQHLEHLPSYLSCQHFFPPHVCSNLGNSSWRVCVSWNVHICDMFRECEFLSFVRFWFSIFVCGLWAWWVVDMCGARSSLIGLSPPAHCNALQHNATHCNALQHTATQ